jgi:hypothetical protein
MRAADDEAKKRCLLRRLVVRCVDPLSFSATLQAGHHANIRL